MKRVVLYLVAAMSLCSVVSVDARLLDPELVRNHEYYAQTEISKYDWDEPAARNLVLEGVEGKLTKRELRGMKEYLLNYELPLHNRTNYYFRKRMNSYMMEWVYDKDPDIELLNRAIEVARRAVLYRNDNIGEQDEKYDSYKVSFDLSVAPVWPNLKEAALVDGDVVLSPGASVFAPLPCITVPVRMIANNKGLWKRVYQGKSYYDIAMELAAEANKTIDYVYDVFVGEDSLIRYPQTTTREEWRGLVFIFNRVFPIMSGAIPLIEAYETLGVEPERVAEMDRVNGAMIDYLLSVMSYHTKRGVECVHYPYSEASMISAAEAGKVQSEDFTHGSFDSRDLQLFYLSGRYNLSQREIEAMANTLVEVSIMGNGTFCDRLSGDGKARKYGTPISYDGYIWYAAYRPEIYSQLIDYVLTSGIARKNGVYDAYILYEILKLKDKR